MLEKIIEYIKQKYNPLSIILYGSYANGTNNLNSDFDALVISYDHEQFHDTSFVNDIQLDVFVYPASYFDGEFDCNNFIQKYKCMSLVCQSRPLQSANKSKKAQKSPRRGQRRGMHFVGFSGRIFRYNCPDSSE